MKKYIIAALISIATIAFCEDSEYAVTVAADQSTTILAPAYKPGTYDPWIASTAVTNGTNLRSGSQYYMVLTTGTTGTNAPTSKAGGLITDGTAELLYINTSGRGLAVVTQEADASLWYHSGTTATTNGGVFAYLKAQPFYTSRSGAVSVWSDAEVKLNVSDQ